MTDPVPAPPVAETLREMAKRYEPRHHGWGCGMDGEPLDGPCPYCDHQPEDPTQVREREALEAGASAVEREAQARFYAVIEGAITDAALDVPIPDVCPENAEAVRRAILQVGAREAQAVKEREELYADWQYAEQMLLAISDALDAAAIGYASPEDEELPRVKDALARLKAAEGREAQLLKERDEAYEAGEDSVQLYWRPRAEAAEQREAQARAALRELRDALRDSLRDKYLLNRHDEPLDRYGLRLIRVVELHVTTVLATLDAAPPQETRDKPLCETCGGNGVLKIPGGVSECPQCQGRCWA